MSMTTKIGEVRAEQYIPQLVTVEELAKRLALPVTWLRDASRSRCVDPIPCIRLGRYVRFDLEDHNLAAWINRRRVAAARERTH